MRFTVVLLPEAEQDIYKAYWWYEEKRNGLGELFLEELVTVYHKLERNPDVFSWIDNTYRQAILNRFPFVIIYRVIGTKVLINSVFHTSRDPKTAFKDI